MNNSTFPRFFFPDENVPSVKDIDYEGLMSSGIEAVIFDLDNTIARWEEDSLPDEIIDLFERLTSMGLKLGILTNSRREAIEDHLVDLPFPHVFNASKPSGRGFKLMLDKLDVMPEQAAMIGDQLLTDVLGANRMNIYTIRVDPIDPDKEYRFTKINRFGESFLLSLREVYRAFRGSKKT